MSGTATRRSRPTWTAERVRRELKEFLDGETEWPSYRDFQRAGRQALRNQVTRFGGARLWAKRLGLRYPERKPGYPTRWTEDRVRAELSQYLRGRSAWPTRLEFEQAGRKPLRDAIRRLGGPERWAAEFELSLPSLKSGSKLAWTSDRIESELRRLIGDGHTWPGRRELELNGQRGIVHAVYTHGGAEYWARRVGVKRSPRPGSNGARIWTDARIRAELEDFCRGRSTWPTEREFTEAGRYRLYAAACHHGGAGRWASELRLLRVRPRD